MKLFLLFCITTNAFALTIDEYQEKALGEDIRVEKNRLFFEGHSLLVDSYKNLTGPSLISGISKLDDKRPTANPMAQGTKTEVESLYLGVRQISLHGFDWSFTQNVVHSQIHDASPAFLPRANYYDFYPKVELKANLWRNFLGREISNYSENQRLQNISQKDGAALNLKKEKIAVMNDYDRHYAAHRLVEIHEDSLERSEKLLSWAKNKSSKNLIDESDLYSVQASVAARQVNLVDARENYRKTLREINRRMNQDLEKESGDVETPMILISELLLEPSQSKKRADLKIKRNLELATKAMAISKMESFKPNLDLSLMALKQGRGVDNGAAFKDYQDRSQNEYIVALNFSMPLDIPSQLDYLKGFNQLTMAGDLSTLTVEKDQELSWNEFVDIGKSLSQKYKIVDELEEIQRKRADAERAKFNQGRSTTFQVLSYEQDYLATRSQKVSLELAIREFILQKSLFE